MKATPERYVTTEEVADFLNKPVGWLHHHAAARSLPRYKVGRHYRYRLSEVAAWVERQGR